MPSDAGPGTEADEPPFSRGQALPGYSPDFNADEAIWGWVREEVTGNLCLGTKGAVQSLPLRRQGRGSETSLTGCPAGKRKSNTAAAPSCNQGLKVSYNTPSQILNTQQMHIPPWL